MTGDIGNTADNAAILFDKFHLMRRLGETPDAVRKSGYARPSEGRTA